MRRLAISCRRAMHSHAALLSFFTADFAMPIAGDHPISLERATPVDYAVVKSPVDREYVDDALRPANGPISIYHISNLDMAAHLAGTITGVIYSVLNNYLHMSTTLVATATALVTFPRALRLGTGMLTDRVPIFGYRRRPYMIIGWLLSFVSCLLMAALPLGEPYYRDHSLSKIAADKLTAEQKLLINLDAPNHGIRLIILMMIANVGIVMAYSGFNGVLVDVSQREPEHLRGTAMGDCTIVHYVFGVISSFMTGMGLNSVDYGGSFSWTIGFSAVMWICSAASLLTIPFSIWCIQEPKVTRVPEKSAFVFLYELLQKRHIYRFVAFNFFYNRLGLNSGIANYAINLVPLAFVVFLPRQKAELREMERSGRKNRVLGTLTLTYLCFSLAWTLMTNILSLSTSTKNVFALLVAAVVNYILTYLKCPLQEDISSM
ncbi:hypothetical protein AC1031_001496 [Aphanomyces cochlioides]|nr:hypothetical protein AC1031_001496 [Aphanomyces cochlioides]